jgi:beta-lactamase class C
MITSIRLATGLLVMATIPVVTAAPYLPPDFGVERIVAREIAPLLPANGAGGVAAAVRIGGRTLFYNFGTADLAAGRPVTSDLLFNIASIGKVFDATLLAQSTLRGEMSLDDPVVKYVGELGQGGDIRRVTVGQLATHTSGLLLPQDHPPWPTEHYTLPEFIRALNAWTAEPHHRPGEQHMYTHAGYMLLHLAIERRFGKPFDELIAERVVAPLGLGATLLPPAGANPRGELPAVLKGRAVQGYDEDGTPVGEPGDIQGYYLWRGTGQMFSSARDLATFVAANLGDVSVDPELARAMALARQSAVVISPHNRQGLAWEINLNAIPIVEKNGGLNNSSTYVGLMPSHKLGVVILNNRGNQDPATIGRRILLELAKLE